MPDPRFVNPDGTVRIVSDRRLMRVGRIDPVIVEMRRLFAPWQAEADARVIEDRRRMAAMENQGTHHHHTHAMHPPRWQRVTESAAD